MTTDVSIRVMSLDYNLKRQIVDEINSKYILMEIDSGSRYMILLRLDADDVSRDSIIGALSEGVLEYIDTIEVSKKKDAVKEEVAMDVNPFRTADTYLQ